MQGNENADHTLARARRLRLAFVEALLCPAAAMLSAVVDSIPFRRGHCALVAQVLQDFRQSLRVALVCASQSTPAYHTSLDNPLHVAARSDLWFGAAFETHLCTTTQPDHPSSGGADRSQGHVYGQLLCGTARTTPTRAGRGHGSLSQCAVPTYHNVTDSGPEDRVDIAVCGTLPVARFWLIGKRRASIPHLVGRGMARHLTEALSSRLSRLCPAAVLSPRAAKETRTAQLLKCFELGSL